MSITSEINRTAEMVTDGVETGFDFSLLIHAESELQVFYKVTGGDYAQLTLNTNYTVEFNDAGGTITTTGPDSPYAAGTLLIIRHLPLTQTTNWIYNDLHTEEAHQRDFDRSCMRDLQLQEGLDRCPQFPIESPTTGITFPEPYADAHIGWDSAGVDLENKVILVGITIPAMTKGSVPFADGAGALTEDNDNFFYDDANNTLRVKRVLAGGVY